MTIHSRCEWANGSELECLYHDTEWGVPQRKDNELFEFLTLEGAQAGLSWRTVLAKREGYRAAFDQFDVEKIAVYSQREVDQLLQNSKIVRNRLKIESTVTNAQAFLAVQEKFGSFAQYIWRFTEGKIIQNRWKNSSDVPVSTKQSDAMSRDLKLRGFKFVGTTICYAYMQAVGMVNDHTLSCFRHAEVAALDSYHR